MRLLVLFVTAALCSMLRESLDVKTALLGPSDLPEMEQMRLPSGWKVPTVLARQRLPLYHKISPSFGRFQQWDPFRFLSDPGHFLAITSKDASLPASFLATHLSELFKGKAFPSAASLSQIELKGLLAFLMAELVVMKPSERPTWAGELQLVMYTS